MKRKEFITSTVLGLGMLSVSHKLSASSILNNTDENINPKILKAHEGKKQMVLGDRQTVKLTGKDTNGLYTLIEQQNTPGVEIPMHIHQDEDEVFHVLEGELEIIVGGDIKVLKAGDIGFCPRGIPHSWKVVGKKKAKVMLSIFPAGLELMFDEFTQLPEGPPDFKKVSDICKKYNIQFV